MHDMYVNLTLLAFITMVSPASMEKSKLEEVELYKELQVVRLIAYENKLASYIKKTSFTRSSLSQNDSNLYSLQNHNGYVRL